MRLFGILRFPIYPSLDIVFRNEIWKSKLFRLLLFICNPCLFVIKGVYKGFTRKGLQSRSATASLLIRSKKCMKENRYIDFCCPGTEK